MDIDANATHADAALRTLAELEASGRLDAADPGLAHAYLRLAGVLDLGQLPKADLLREFRLLHLALCRSDDDDGDDGPTLIEIIEADRAAAKAKP